MFFILVINHYDLLAIDNIRILYGANLLKNCWINILD
jgi:hypothetical protein